MALSDRLREARHAHFVGREGEVQRFTEALHAERLPFHVLHVYGPGGVGKTTLLQEFRYRCEQAGVPVRYLDAREVEPSPEALLRALGAAAPSLALPLLRERADAGAGRVEGGERDVGGDGALGGEAMGPAERYVLLLDTVEAIGGLDGWLREAFLPQMPEALLVVLAGRNRPAPPWRTDPGWSALTAEMPLSGLSDAESRALLTALGVPEARHDAALDFAGGHPLALALVAEVSRGAGEAPFAPGDAPGVIGTLVQRLVEEVPGPAHREALEACAAVRATTESLLGALVEGPADALFAWLRGLTFVQEGPHGLFPHDLARDAITAELRWRAPDRYEALHARARRYYTAQLQEAATPEAHRALLAGYAFLFRDNPVARPLIAQLRAAWSDGGPGAVGQPKAHEWDALRALVEAHEGEAAAACAAHWFERQPEGVEVFRDEEGAVSGLLVRLALERVTDEDAGADPAVAAARAALQAHAPLREGERAILFRLWMGREAHQEPSAVQSALFAQMVWHYLTTPDLAYSILLCAVPHTWGPILAFADLFPLPDADVSVGGCRYEAFAHDWRAVPPDEWLRALSGRTPAAAPTAEEVAPLFDVLSRSAFADAVKAALKEYARPQRLLESPLLGTRLVGLRAGSEADEAERVEALCALIGEAAQQLEHDPREGRYYKPLEVTYLKPARSQAVAAERLDLPFSTFRRHLDRAVGYVTDVLWGQEVGQATAG